MNPFISILSGLLIVFGGVIILLAIMKVRGILHLSEVQKYKYYWKGQLSLMIFFLFAYIVIASMIFLGMARFLTIGTGIILFFGATFVHLIVRIGSLTLGDIQKSQDELETVIKNRTAELRNEISEHEKSEERLRKSEESFRALSESSPLLIIRIDKEARIQYINHVVPPFTHEGVVGRPVYDFIHPDWKQVYEKNLEIVFKNNQVVKLELKGMQADKKMGWYFSTIAPIRGKAGAESAIILTSDISDQKKTEEELTETASLLQAIFDSAVEGILVVDKNGKIVTLNKQFKEIWKIPQEILDTKDDDKALGFAISQLKKPDQFLHKVKELYSQPEAISFDMIEFKDGKVLERYSMPHRRNGEIVGRVWNFIDVTKIKRAEEVFKLSREKFRKLVEEVADVVYSCDTEGYFTYINPVVKKLTGYHETELLGRHFSILISPAWRKRVIRFYLHQFREEIRETVFSFPIITKSGKEQWVEQTVNQIHQGKAVAGFQAICRDISERKMMEAKLESSNRDLENFAYIASHDLQEPLRMVVSFLGLLEQNLKERLDKDSKEFLDFAVDGANRMKLMISDLLSYSRITSRGAEFKKTNLNLLLKDVLLNLKEKISESHAEIISVSLPEIVADPIKMVRLFQNLISNAIKFSREGEKPVVKIGHEEKPDSWLFSVQDNGIGIKPEHFSKIFIIFKRLHPKDEYPGTGIGLAECKKIVELHNGTIWIESEEGKGSTFYFTIKKNLEPIKNPNT